MAREGWLCLSLVAAAGCPSPARAQAGGPEETSVAGPSGGVPIRPGPVCELPDDRRFRVWIRGPSSPAPSFASGGNALTATSTESDGGMLYTLTVPEDARVLEIAQSGRM